MKRWYVSDIRKDLIMRNLDRKSVIDTFGRYFKDEHEARYFILENPSNSIYVIETEKNKILNLLKIK
jgi:hypothetical protein